MATLVENCPRCGAQKIAFDVRGANRCGTYETFSGEQIPEYEVYCVCRECQKTTIYLCDSLERARDLSALNWSMALFRLTEVAKVKRPINPADLDAGEPPEFLPQNIHDAYEEGAKCLTIGCYNAAGTMFRLCLDYATKDLLPEGDAGPNQKIRRSLGLRMDWLFDNQKLPESLRSLAECVKDDGNDGAHEGALDHAAAEDLEDFTYIFLERLYTEPQRLVQAKARREDRRKNR
ncbi:DUF4145 domain-containing protein [Klebsiella pneumoniae]|uniref:DUF4145 domain-containing protein n=1 Tax=Klebsiella pneumoniae TaxID=573 RepID=UPI0020231BD6|nr:DUF4145 domain-containing protein [Klebsiella pneumoniae]MCL8235410.1 DUF4145 domain-containing protein [Klebsiella pneumoniae]